MNTFQMIPATTEQQVNEIAVLANEIWHEHFIPIIGEQQVDYMVGKFQSYPALKTQLDDGYEYFQIYTNNDFAGYTGIHEENNSLFLSKLYIKKDCRGKHLSTQAFHFLVNLCIERGLSHIWLTCNKYNANTLAVYDHMGFYVTDEQVSDIGNGYVMDDYILTYRIPRNPLI